MSQADPDELSSVTAPEGGEILRAQLAIEPQSDLDCAVIDQVTDVDSFAQDLKRPRSCFDGPDDCTPGACGECHVEVTPENTDNRSQRYFKSPVRPNCICPVFEEHDCIPEITGVRGGSIVTVVTVRDRPSLKALLQELRTVEASVSVDWLVRGREGEATMEISVEEITTKQREALDIALDAGYYSTPRETDLGELADRLSISESAVSQRLNAAETKLVKSFLDE